MNKYALYRRIEVIPERIRRSIRSSFNIMWNIADNKTDFLLKFGPTIIIENKM